MVESGEIGWSLIEYQELFASAVEYLGSQCVMKISIDRNKNYLRVIQKELSRHMVTHYVYDPRTGSQKWGSGLFQALILSVLFAWYRVIPIARLSDMQDRRWRIQCAIVTSERGICTTVLVPGQMRKYFPHRRLIGPMMMALSHVQLTSLQQMRTTKIAALKPRAIFTGALYEPRKTFLLTVQKGLQGNGLDLEIFGRALGEDRASNHQYWKHLVDADVVVTTANPNIEPGSDQMDVLHLLYRYSEVLAAGALLGAPSVPGIEKYFRPGIDFVSIDSPDDAVKKIMYYLDSAIERANIAENGMLRLMDLVQSNTYWRLIDIGLGRHGFPAT